jgi:copper chaperone NosL
MHSKLSPSTRIAILLASVAMFAVLWFPIWRIELSAPQYPEGLVLQIFSDHIGGDVDVVNGLNHYIGMHPLHTRDFVEFQAIPYIIGGFAVLGLIVMLINRRVFFFAWATLFLLIAFTSMIDFYRWEYNYGHNLNPEAPIQVPGMAYQPPMLGYKKLLNFGAYSIPDIGGWLFVIVGVLVVSFTILEWRRAHKAERIPVPTRAAGLLLLPLLFTLPSCQSGPQPIRYGQDNCDFCKMTFSDRRYGGEICTKKGKALKFDDLHCLLESLKANTPARNEVAGVYLVDYSGGTLVEAGQAFLLKSPAFQTPMGSNIAAFANPDTLKTWQVQNNGQPLTWKELSQ